MSKRMPELISGWNERLLVVESVLETACVALQDGNNHVTHIADTIRVAIELLSEIDEEMDNI